MSRHSAWRAGGVTRFYTEAATVAEAQQLARMAESNRLPLVWLGRGTNVLVRDAGFPGLIVGYRAEGWQLDEQGDTALVRVAAGTSMAGLARHLSAKGWAGLAWAEGLPGTVGGAVVGNAGCYGGDIASMLQSAEILVGVTVETWPTQRLAYGYRTSALKVGDGGRGSGVGGRGSGVGGRGSGKGGQESGVGGQESGVGDQGATPIPDPRSPIPHPSSPIPDPPSPIPLLVLAATFRLQRGDPAELVAHMAAIAAQRKAKTPVGHSCGSVFKNPPGASAGQLIEAAGLKGRTIGGAVISPVHANYIINTGTATATDILALIEVARTEVARQFALELALEVRII